MKSKRRPLSIKWKFFLSLLLFAGVLLLLLWLLQVVFLESFYKFYKTREIRRTAEVVAENIDDGQIGSLLEQISRQQGISAAIVDPQDMTVLRRQEGLGREADFASQEQLQLCYEKAWENGGTYLAQKQGSVPGKEHHFSGWVPPGQGMLETILCATLVDSQQGERLVVLTSQITPVGSTVEALRAELVCISAILLVFALVLALWVSRKVTGPIVRINTDDNMVSDDYLVSRSFTVMRSIYDQYQRDYGGETEEPDPDNETNGNSSTPPPSTNENPNASGEPVEEDPEAKPVVYLAFEGDLNDSTGQILDILQESGYQATFFVTGRLHAGNVEYLARAAAAGHTIGNNLDGYAGVGAGFQDLAQEAAATTEAVQAVIKTRPRLLMVPGGSASLTQEEVDALVESGYRLWDGSFETQAQTAGAIYSACLSHLEGASGHVVLNLRSSPENAEALSSLVDYFRSNGYEVRPITDVVASINQILDKR